MSPAASLKARNLRLIGWLSLVLVAMSVLVAFMVPLYRLVCKRLGISTELQRPDPSALSPGEGTREVTVRFVGVVNAGAPARLEPLLPSVTVRVGQTRTVHYRAENLSDRPLDFQAVHSVFPPRADGALHKVECFCYTRQRLAAHQRLDMPLAFWVDPQLEPGIDTLTLQYTVFALDPVR